MIFGHYFLFKLILFDSIHMLNICQIILLFLYKTYPFIFIELLFIYLKSIVYIFFKINKKMVDLSLSHIYDI